MISPAAALLAFDANGKMERNRRTIYRMGCLCITQVIKIRQKELPKTFEKKAAPHIRDCFSFLYTM